MKKLILFLFPLGLALIYAISSPTTDNTASPSGPSYPQSLLGQTQTNDCNSYTYKLFPEAVYVWNRTWSSSMNVPVGSGVRTIKAHELQLLYNQSRDAKEENHGLRIYYGLVAEADSIPELLLVNTVSCQDVYHEDSVLMVKADTSRFSGIPEDAASERWITAETAAKYAGRWRELKRLENRTPVYAYNYRWDQIKQLVGDDLTKDLHIVYGIRTISPQENETDFLPAFVNADSPEETRYGSIVYVNVLYTGDLMASDDEDDEPAMDDFSRPCPRFCDPESGIAPIARN